jgi:PKD repeat protein
VYLSLLSSPSGTALSATDVLTQNGVARFTVFAPPSTSTGDVITVGVTPAGTNAANAVARTVQIDVTPSNPSAPVAAFTFSPAAPAVGDVVTFNASTTTDSGTACGAACTYVWTFADGTTATGMIVSRSFSEGGGQSVTLTVTDSGGATSSATQTVSVTLPTAPAAGTITFGPTPVRPGATTQFDAGAATVGTGASIVEYTWFWGDGTADTITTTPQASHAFASIGIYTVRVTVRDSLNRTATSSVSVTVSSTAAAP